MPLTHYSTASLDYEMPSGEVNHGPRAYNSLGFAVTSTDGQSNTGETVPRQFGEPNRSSKSLSIMCAEPSKPSRFRETEGSRPSYLHRACRICEESLGQSSIEQKAADALEPRGRALSVASPRRAAKRHVDRRLPSGESSLSCRHKT